MAEIQPIADYSDFNKPPHLMGYLTDSDLVNILSGMDVQFNQFEIAGQEFFSKLWLNSATGAQLDLLGVHLGFPRESRDDDSYRTLLRLITFLNTGSGEPETIIKAAKALFGATEVVYSPDYPAKFTLTINGSIFLYLFFDTNLDGGFVLQDQDGNNIILQELDSSANDLFQQLIPSGVGVTLVEV